MNVSFHLILRYSTTFDSEIFVLLAYDDFFPHLLSYQVVLFHCIPV